MVTTVPVFMVVMVIFTVRLWMQLDVL